MRKWILRTIAVAVAFGLVWPPLSWGFGAFTVTQATITPQLSGDYRVEIYVDWDRTPISAFTTDRSFDSPEFSPTWRGNADPYLTRFATSGFGSMSNFTAEYGYDRWTDPTMEAPEWHSQGYGHSPGSLGSYFAFDFSTPFLVDEPISFEYSAMIDYVSPVVRFDQNGYPVEQYGDWLGQSESSGQFTATVVPEPTTLVLVGLGLMGAGLLRRRILA